MPALLLLACLGHQIGQAYSQPGSELLYYRQVKSFPVSSPDSAFVAFYISIPYSSLVFVKEKSGYGGGYRFNLFLLRDKDDVIFEKSWQESIRVQDYGETKKDSISYDLFVGSTFHAGNYKVVIESIDKNIGLSGFKEFEISISDHTGEKVVLGDILAIRGNPDLSEDHQSQVKLIPGNTIRDDFTLYCEALLLEEVPGLITEIVWLKNNKEVRRDALNFDQVGNRLKLYRAYSIEEIPHGRFTVQFSVGSDNKKAKSQSILLEIFKKSEFIAESDLDLAIDQLRYIGGGPAYDSLLSAGNLESRQYWFDQFWRETYPSQDSLHNPIKEEYYRRVRYTEQSFIDGDSGWLSDRGHTLILYGHPDHVQRRSDSRMRNYEIWNYTSLDIKFVFLDEFGTGRFRLIQGYLP